jgi:NMD protein affecting ribosome stability and mRNA decay
MTISAAAAAKKDDNMERLQEHAIAALKIKNNKAICQHCNKAIPIVGKWSKRKDACIDALEKRIRWLEHYPANNNSTAAEINQAKEELAVLQAESDKQDKLRNIPLLSGRITGFKFVCSSCYDYFYQLAQEERKKRP